jgi:hypothetical protein
MEFTRNGDVAMFHNGIEMARTALIGSGGFEVNNTVTGAGFERVLTVSDLGGGGGQVDSVGAGTNINVTGTAVDPIVNFEAAGTEFAGAILSWGGSAWDVHQGINVSGFSSSVAVFTDTTTFDNCSVGQFGNTTLLRANQNGTPLQIQADQIQLLDVALGGQVQLQCDTGTGQVLARNTVTGAGLERILTASDLGGGGGTPGGADTQVQFNNAGAFDGDAGLTWNDTNSALTIGGSLFLNETTADADITGKSQLYANASRNLVYRDEGGDGFEIGDGSLVFRDIFNQTHTWTYNSGGNSRLTFTSTNISDTRFPRTLSVTEGGGSGVFSMQYSSNRMVFDTNEACSLRIGPDVNEVELRSGAQFLLQDSSNLDPIIVRNGSGRLIVDCQDSGTDGMRLLGNASIYLEEQAAARADIAGDGQLWVRDDTPNVLVFRDDAGNETVLNRNPTSTTTALEDATNAVNTSALKRAGYQVFNTTTNKPVWATGGGDTDVWVDATGTTEHTPV